MIAYTVADYLQKSADLSIKVLLFPVIGANVKNRGRPLVLKWQLEGALPGAKC